MTLLVAEAKKNQARNDVMMFRKTETLLKMFASARK